MRFFEFRNTTKTAINEAAARIQHAEDIVFWEGSQGAKRALQSLANLAKGGHKDVTVKWDGCVHPDSLIMTNNNLMRIEDAIDYINNGNKLSVLQFDIKNNTLEMSLISNAIKKEGQKDWIEIELENGDTITLTEDHEVYTTNRGWIQAKDLNENDDVKHIVK